ncbi:hypothetical protein D3C74_240350 [compost metagenome]
MNINNVVDGFLASDVSPDDKAEQKRLLCQLFLMELEKADVEELIPHFRSMDLKKKERQVVVTLTFPLDITCSNFLGCN